MSVKYIALLFIFFVNLVATSLADSSHIEIKSHETTVEHSHSHDSSDNKEHDKHTSSKNSSSDHCHEHEGCHNTHYHHYIFSTDNTFVNVTYVSSVKFIEANSHYSSNFLDIIKPPIV